MHDIWSPTLIRRIDTFLYRKFSKYQDIAEIKTWDDVYEYRPWRYLVRTQRRPGGGGNP